MRSPQLSASILRACAKRETSAAANAASIKARKAHLALGKLYRERAAIVQSIEETIMICFG